ncbi:MAG: hypothetical protein CFE28_03905 [Alphaproteobacteria bacterium PA2]|nr:MAG: hypothetical protein CFE28_03905 [Alphaproteobacteria bacterium PA2]
MEFKRQSADIILNRADMLNIEQFALHIGAARVEVRRRTKRREFISIEGSYFGARFPTWQVNEIGEPFNGIRDLYQRFMGDAWKVYDFLTEPNPRYQNYVPLELLQTGKLDQLLSLADASPPEPRRKG